MHAFLEKLKRWGFCSSALGRLGLASSYHGYPKLSETLHAGSGKAFSGDGFCPQLCLHRLPEYLGSVGGVG